jgi:predicted RNA-binding Zn ribbon-like protein
MEFSDHTSKGQDGARQRRRFAFIGGHLALDFTNSLGGRRGGSMRETVTTYADLVAWGLQAGMVVADEAHWLLDAAQRDPARAAVVVARARRLREAVYTLITTHMRGEIMPGVDLALLNSELALAVAHRRLAINDHGHDLVWAWDWRQEGAMAVVAHTGLTLDTLLWPLAVAAADLLSRRPERPPLRQCASDECSWLYLDTTRNHSRRWCDMKGCGNKAKVRRYRQRQP